MPGLQELRAAWIGFDLPAQAVHNVFEKDLVTVPVPTPDRLDNILCTERMARTTHESMQQSKFKVGQLDFQPVGVDQAAPGRFQPVFPRLYLS